MNTDERPLDATDAQWANKHFRNGYLNTWDWTGESRPLFGKENQAIWSEGVRLRAKHDREAAFRWQFANAGRGMRATEV